jgi:hypothetical protein
MKRSFMTAFHKEGKMWQAWERSEMKKWRWGFDPKKRDRKKYVGFDEKILLTRTLKKEEER